MNSSRRSWYGILIAVISILMVGGALLTALAQSQFSLDLPEEIIPTATDFDIPDETGSQPSATFPPTETPQESSDDSPTATQQVAENTPVTQVSTNTPFTFTPANTQAGSSSAVCGAPNGWIQYTVQSGDTLFSISQKFQSTVFSVQLANCMGSSTKIITGSKLWVPNNPTITPSVTSAPTATDKPAATNTKSPTATHTATSTATNTTVPSATNTATSTPTATATPMATATATATDTTVP